MALCTILIRTQTINAPHMRTGREVRMTSNSPLFEGLKHDRYSSFTLRDLVSVVFKHKLIISITFLLVTFVVISGLLALPATFEFKAKVLIKTEQQATPSFFSGLAALREDPNRNPVNRTIETEMELIEARSISEEVVQRLGLNWWDVYHKPLAYFMDVFINIYNKAAPKAGLPKYDDQKTVQDTIAAFNRSFVIAPTRSKSAETNSNFVQITMKSPKKQIGVDALNLLLKIYQDYDIRLNREAGQRAYKIVEKKLKEAELQVHTAQKNLADFLASHKVTRHPATMKLPVKPAGSEETSTISLAGTVRPPNIADGEEARWASNAVLSTPQDVNSISLIKARLIEMEIKHIELSKRYPASEPRIVALRESITEIRQRLAQELTENAGNESQLISLERDLEMPEIVFKQLKKRLTEISLFLEANESSIRPRLIVEEPIIPSSSEWKKKLIVGILGSLGGLMLGLFFAGFREYNDHTLASKDEVKRHTGLNVLVTFPLLNEKALKREGDRDDPAPGTSASDEVKNSEDSKSKVSDP